MYELLSFLHKIKSGLIYFEKTLASISLLLLLILSISQVVLRNIFELGFSDIDVVARHLVLFITFMGAALISEGNRHIKIDCVTSAFSDAKKQKLKSPLLFISTIISFIFLYYSIVFWLDEYQYAPDNEQLALYMALILPAGFLTLSIHFFLLALTHHLDEPSIVDITQPPVDNN